MLLKNLKTQETEKIEIQDLEQTDWGFRFFVETELEAYKAGYQYRFNTHGYKVEFAGGCGKWMVTVFNDKAKGMGVKGVK